MKKMQKLLAVLFAFAMVASLCTTAFADVTSGSITIKNAVKDATYTVYKIFDAKVGTDSISYSYTGELAANDYFEKDANGNITMKAAAEDSNGKLTAGAVTFLSGLASTAAATKKCEDGKSITVSGLAYGYYLIKNDRTGNVITVETVDESAVTVYDKADAAPAAPSNGKFKTVDDGATATDAAYGSAKTFTVAFKAVNYIVEDGDATQVDCYKVTDTPDNVSIDWDTVTVSVGGTVLTSDKYTVAGNIITINWVDGEGKSLYANPADVVITYSATVGLDGSSNTVEIAYSLTGNDTFETFADTDNEVTLSNYAVTVKNVLNGSTELAGATYKLTTSDGTTDIELVAIDGGYRIATADDTNTVTEIAAGTVTVKGLGNGTYEVVQVNPTEGYDAAEAQTFTIDDANEVVTFNNVNGVVLPGTGSKSAAILSVLGVLAALAAGIFLVTNKKMSKENF